jgi:hypothetical protein
MNSKGSGDATDVVLDSPLTTLAGSMSGVFFVVVLALVLLSSDAEVPGSSAWVLGGLSLFFFVTNWWYSVRTSFHRDFLVFERGIGPLKRTTKVSYLSVGRVRAEAWAMTVTMSLDNGRTLPIAHLYTRVRGELPDVAFKEGESSAPIRRMRQIAKLVDQRVARAQGRARPPAPRFE